MEPFIASLVASLAAGAIAASKDVASSAVKNGYGAIKRLLIQRYGTLDIDSLEQDPKNAQILADLAQAAENSDISSDLQISTLIEKFKTALKENAELSPEIGVELSDIKVGKAKIADVLGFEKGVVISGATIDELDLSNIKRS